MKLSVKHKTTPWHWIPSLYLAEGIPNVTVMLVSVVMYKSLQVSNTDIALYTGILYLPWVIKPLWSPFVDILKTKRWWILMTQLAIGAGLAGVAFALSASHFLFYTLGFLWFIAFCSATHDIAADGFYMLGLPVKEQAYFIGIRNTFYRLATVVALSGTALLTGILEKRMSLPQAWQISFGCLGVLFLLFRLYHQLLLPHPVFDKGRTKGIPVLSGFWETFLTFFCKKQIGIALSFMLLYRLSEAQLSKLSYPFLMDSHAAGGLQVNISEVGFIYGTIGIIALSLGGIAGGILVARDGLRHWLFRMTVAMNIPNLVYVYMAFFQPEHLGLISAFVAIEQFGYGFGFTAYALYLISFSEGPHKTAHYALCTGFMALGMMLPGMISGWLADVLGYRLFFLWIMLCTLPGFLLIRYLKIPDQPSLTQPK